MIVLYYTHKIFNGINDIMLLKSIRKQPCQRDLHSFTDRKNIIYKGRMKQFYKLAWLLKRDEIMENRKQRELLKKTTVPKGQRKITHFFMHLNCNGKKSVEVMDAVTNLCNGDQSVEVFDVVKNQWKMNGAV